MTEDQKKRKRAVSVFVDTFARADGLRLELVTPTEPVRNALARATLVEALAGETSGPEADGLRGWTLTSSTVGRRVLD